MTAGEYRYADAAGLVERSAAAYVSSVPDRPGGRRLLRAGQRHLAAQRRPVLARGRPAGAADPGAAPAGDGRGRPAQRLAPRPGRQARRHLGLPRHGQLRRPGGGRAGRGQGPPDPRARPRHRPGDRPPVRGRRSRPAAVGARDAGRIRDGRLRAVRHAAGRGRRRPLRGGDGGRGRAGRRAGRAWSRPAWPSLRRVPVVGPARAALHAGGRRVDGLPARPARPGPGHRGDLAGHPRRRGRRAAGVGAARCTATTRRAR